ncbi:non-ribosomal peptide synthetase [Bailinhaonella thermotolerans]|uniref:non-ribosomal peptide synthetase n=1 Tax=Bailinhaonella thermotolerans TaxID=1070861 RepID=UPI001F5B9899|nr:non-ribosomal peptide synthetase [Bailinhaonella thermotolerans]
MSTLGELIVAQAARTPGAVAIRQWDTRMTYGALAEAALNLAAELRRRGVGPETRVGVCARRTPLMPVSALGIMLAGGAYVPLDPAHPRDRLTGVIEDAGIGIVVADAPGRALLAGAPAVLLDPSAAPPSPGSPPGPAAGSPPGATPREPYGPAGPGNAAYVLYTSGSTGRPKGVVVSHRSAVAFVTMAAESFGLDASCRSIAFSALGFDVSVLDMFAPLTRGGAVQLVPDEDRVDPGRLRRFLREHDVTWGFIPPALLPLLDPRELPELRDLVTAGEPPGPEQVARWAAPGRRFHNWYGPTETTVCVVGTELTGEWDRPLPIGHALPGCTAHILDEDMRPCPPGVAGELHIGGPQVARGYLNRPGLTAARFVPDPFSGEPGARLYKTGDQVRWEPDGRIGFVGRLDRQVKIQGQRVELGEVESVLRAHPSVLQAVADASGGELVAYLTPADAPDLPGVREYCARRLPPYMIPTRVVRLDVLPLNPSGKVDLRALSAPPAGGPPSGASELEEEHGGAGAAVTRIWARVLEVAGGPDPADGFLASGGHSLRAMRLVSAVREELGREIGVEDVYAARTLGGLIERVAALEEGSRAAITTGNAPRLTAAQRRMWFVERLAPGTPAHNIAMAERIRGPLDAGALRRALGAVLARHEVLRWRVPERDGMPYVEVAPPGEAGLPVEELPEEAVEGLLAAEAATPFDLARGPLVRARLARLAPDDHVLAVTAHHIVFDGWSQDVFYRDLARAYAGEALPPPETGFADYAAWLAGREADADPAWWREHLADAPTALDLPLDAERPAIQTFRGAAARGAIPPETAAAVRAVSARAGATPYAVLLAAFGRLLGHLTGRDDLVVAAPYADRAHAAFEPLAGCLLQILPLRLRLSGAASFTEHVRGCARELAEAVAHCDVPLQRIVDELGVPRDLARSPLTQVMFNMYNFAGARLRLPGCEAEPLAPGLPGSLFDLTLYVSEDDGGGMALQAVYNPDLFSAARIERLLADYVALLGALAADPERPAGRSGPPPAVDRSRPLPRAAASAGSAGSAGEPGVVELVTAAATTGPNAAAVSGAGGVLSRSGVLALARRTAVAVEKAGLAPGSPPDGEPACVGVVAARDAALPALLLGVLSSGARWAVLDAALPPRVLARQAAAAGARGLLLCPGTAVPGTLAHLPVIELAESEADHAPAPPGARGYLAFTSGTTGDPKPVVTPERPLAHFLAWYPREFGLGPRDRFAMLSGLAHDPLLRDVFTPLALGAALCVPPQDLLRDPARLLAWLRAEEITVAHLTPQLARLLYGVPGAAPLPRLRLAALAGDRLFEADAARLRRLAPAARLVNLYGATETPQAQAYHDIPDVPETSRPIPVGRGIPGSRVFVAALPPPGRTACGAGPGRVAGVGELGEVVIEGEHLALGYLGDPELTRARFGDGFYRTGDLGRHRPDGSVEIAGRADAQVKVRGFRVEPGEVEAALLALDEVSAAAVVPVPDGDAEVSLRAYVVPSGPSVRVAAVLERLRETLPGHAVPAEVVPLPALPLTANGKLDRAALPAPRAIAAPRPAGEAVTPEERAIAAVWREVLRRPVVGVDDNFFELGGHSMALAQVQAALGRVLGRDVPMVDLFRFPSVRALARHLAREGPGDPGGGSPGGGHDLAAAARRSAVRRARKQMRIPRSGGS